MLERTSTAPLAASRRQFLAAGLAAPVAALAAAPLAVAKPVAHTGRARVAIVHCPGFRPSSWRDVPTTGAISRLLGEPMSFRDARRRAKAFNWPTPADTVDYWAVVVASDGRKAVQA